MQDAEGAELVGRVWAAVAAAGLTAVRPDVGIILTGSLPVWDKGLELWRRRQVERSQRALEIGCSVASMTPEALMERLCADDLRLTLLAEALNAAAKSTFDAKVAALGRCLANGALALEDMTVLEEIQWTELMGRIELPHLRILQYLMDPASPEVPDGYTHFGEILGVSTEMAIHLTATLESRWLIGGASNPRWDANGGESRNETIYVARPLGVALTERFLLANT